MLKKNVLFVLLLLYCLGAYAKRDTSRYLFSSSFGKMFARHDFQYVSHGHELKIKHPYTGVYFEMSFRWDRFGFKTGTQLIDRDYYEKYPDGQYSGIRGVKYYSTLTCHIFSTSYMPVDHKHLKVILLAGPLISRVSNVAQYDRLFTVGYYRDPYEKKYMFITWSAGLNVEMNLFRQYIWLSGQIQYIARSEHSSIGSIRALAIGLNINISKLVDEDPLKKTRENLIGKPLGSGQ